MLFQTWLAKPREAQLPKDFSTRTYGLDFLLQDQAAHRTPFSFNTLSKKTDDSENALGALQIEEPRHGWA